MQTSPIPSDERFIQEPLAYYLLVSNKRSDFYIGDSTIELDRYIYLGGPRDHDRHLFLLALRTPQELPGFLDQVTENGYYQLVVVDGLYLDMIDERWEDESS